VTEELRQVDDRHELGGGVGVMPMAGLQQSVIEVRINFRALQVAAGERLCRLTATVTMSVATPVTRATEPTRRGAADKGLHDFFGGRN